MREIARVVVRLVAPLARRVRVMVGRCVLEAVDDSRLMQAVKVQVLEGMVRDEVEHFQAGGLTHRPAKGAEGIFLSVGGDSSHGVVILCSDRSQRPKDLEEGETKLYSVGGGFVHLKQDGSIDIAANEAAALAARADRTDTRCENIEAKVEEIRARLEAHHHLTTNKIATGGVNDPKQDTDPPQGTPILPLVPQTSTAADKVHIE